MNYAYKVYAITAAGALYGPPSDPPDWTPDALFQYAAGAASAASKALRDWADWGYGVALGTVRVESMEPTRRPSDPGRP